jgi:hypothetical protein
LKEIHASLRKPDSLLKECVLARGFVSWKASSAGNGIAEHATSLTAQEQSASQTQQRQKRFKQFTGQIIPGGTFL